MNYEEVATSGIASKSAGVYSRSIYMTTTVQKWGNSLALRIPQTVASEISLGEGHSVHLSVNRGRLVVVPATRKRYDLPRLVSGINAKNRHSETTIGKARGREVW